MRIGYDALFRRHLSNMLLAIGMLVWVSSGIIVNLYMILLSDCFRSLCDSVRCSSLNRLALKSSIDGHPESPQLHSWPANTAHHLKSCYMVASSD